MTRISEDVLDDDLVALKLTYQFDRVLQLLECLAADASSETPFVSVIESYSRRKVESAAEQVLSGWSLPRGITCDSCDQALASSKSISVRARRPMGLLTWFLDACVCDDCEVMLDPETDGIDVVASARITRWDDPEGERPLLLSEVSVEEASGTQYYESQNVEVTDEP
jgi:hypothetical protein